MMNMKNRKLFIIWGILVVGIVGLLTTLGFMLKAQDANYVKLENKILDSAKKYIDAKFLYPEGSNVLKVTKEDMIENGFLDELKYGDDTCAGYVTVKLNGAYKYKAYIKCKNYTTKGYE